MEIEVNKDIDRYKETVSWGLRQGSSYSDIWV